MEESFGEPAEHFVNLVEIPNCRLSESSSVDGIAYWCVVAQSACADLHRFVHRELKY